MQPCPRLYFEVFSLMTQEQRGSGGSEIDSKV